MSISPGRYTLGPRNGPLSVRTERGGAVAKAGHNLLLLVCTWEGTFEVGDESSLELRVDATSFKVVEGSGGMQALDSDDIANIEQTIDDEVLMREDIAFRSTQVDHRANGHFDITGDLTLLGETHPITFELDAAGGRLTGSGVVKQTNWGMKPYTALFGALKVLDEVKVEVDVDVPEPD